MATRRKTRKTTKKRRTTTTSRKRPSPRKRVVKRKKPKQKRVGAMMSREGARVAICRAKYSGKFKLCAASRKKR